MQIGVGLSLPLLATRRSGGFSPLSLFTGGTVGAWYDPSDYSTLFQDSAGTTPVTAVEQPVRLMLDKSQGLVLGSELVTGAITWGFSGDTSWTQVSANTVSSTGSTNTNISVNSLLAAIGTQYVQVVMTINFGGGSSGLGVRFDSINPNYGPVTSSGTYRFVGPVDTVSLNIFVYSGFIGTITVSVKVLPGNHALAPNDASRPVLRARYNLLTYSEQFDNAAWTKLGLNAFGSGSVANTTATTDPLGGNTADFIQEDTANSTHRTFQTVTIAAATHTFSIYVKPAGRNWVFVNVGGTFTAYVNISTGAIGTTTGSPTVTATSVGGGWYRVAMTYTNATAGAVNHQVWLASDGSTNTYTGDGTSGVYIWGADLRTGSSVGTYQRIAAATDYATAGFLPYLAFDGVDDNFTVASSDDLNFGQGSFWAQTGMASLGASDFDVIWGKSSASGDNIRLFINSGNNLQIFWGTDAQAYSAWATQITKNISQIQEWGINSTTPVIFYAINGTENTQSITLSGTGSNTTAASIGRNSFNSAYVAQMNLYGMILRKGTFPTASERTSSRSWMAAKAGATL